jgi:predicted PurR-regulated permease PerM
VVILVMFITIWYMLDIVLLTFLITFVFYHLVAWVQRQRKKLVLYQVPDGFILSVLYSLFILVLIFASIVLAPKMAAFITELANILINFNIEA